MGTIVRDEIIYEILETTTCDKCDRVVGLTKDHVPDNPVVCKECGGPWSRMPEE